MNPNRNTLHPLTMLALITLTSTLPLAAKPASADPWNGGSYSRGTNAHEVIDGNVVDVQVRVNGANAPLFFKPGANDRHYFQAFKGRNYSLVLRNTTGARIGVLIAVDGLNVVNGERSTLDRHESMYVLGPWESTEIQGWRSSLSDVRRFVFVDEERSYAERTGQANGDMGWIRVAAYREVQQQTWWGQISRPRRLREDAPSQRRELDGDSRGGNSEHSAPAPAAPEMRAQGEMKSSAPMSDKRSLNNTEGTARDEATQESPGTGWGERRYDPVQQTTFVAQAYAADQLTLRYEYASGLRALGIVIRRPRVWERERGELGFAQPPRW